MNGPDHRASLDTVEFTEMVRQIRGVEKALGNGIKWPNPSEEKIKPLVRRRIVAAHELASGTCLNWTHLTFKRADRGLFVEQADYIVVRCLVNPLVTDEPLDWNSVGDFAIQKNI
jgi:sialic acid synthase SpsE